MPETTGRTIPRVRTLICLVIITAHRRSIDEQIANIKGKDSIRTRCTFICAAQFSWSQRGGWYTISAHMPFLTWLATKMTGEAIKAGGEVAKTATEIPKNIAETRKAHLEVEKAIHEREERNRLITLATMADVERYDPKAKQLKWIADREYRQYEAECVRDVHAHMPRRAKNRDRWLLRFLIAVLIIDALFFVGLKLIHLFH